MTQPRPRFFELVCLFSLFAITCSRLALIIHELIGHGLVAEMLGGDVTRVRFFLFGGGWVRFDLVSEALSDRLIVDLGGVTIEAAIGLVALISLRFVKQPIVALLLLVFSALTLLHAGFYLAAGTHDGYGDGRTLHRILGSSKGLLTYPVAVAVIAGAFVFGRALAERIPTKSVHLLLAAVFAAAIHGGLAQLERVLIPDATYAAIGRTEGERNIEREIAIAERQAQERGGELSEEEQRALREKLDQVKSRIRFRVPLGIFVAWAWMIAVFLRRKDNAELTWTPTPPRTWLTLLGACAGSIVLVGLLAT